MKCNKCESPNFKLVLDKRGVPEARCADCDSYIRKIGVAEIVDLFEDLRTTGDKPVATEPPVKKELAPCRYCTERWAILTGRIGVQPRPMNDIKFCPMCGRELKPEDKNY